jgi:hypothetical protein
MGMKVNGTTGLVFPDDTALASAGQASVRAWVNFNGTGTVAIRANYNVASITDNGTGDYTVNFTTAMPDANYSVVSMASNDNVTNTGASLQGTTPLATSAFRLQFFNTSNGAGGQRDPIVCGVAIFR